jgi:transcriptional regulator with XRE-family HTH domain
MKRKTDSELPSLCTAVKRVREVYGDTQERFARRIGVAVMTVSRFETGRAEPRDPRVLMNLMKVSRQKGPNDAHDLFSDALEDLRRLNETDRRIQELGLASGEATFRSMREWRLSCAARLAVLYFPEQVTAIEKAASAVISIIDEVLSKADENQIDYARFEREVFELAERRALLELKQGKKKQ